MKKSTIILIAFVTILFVIQISMLFQVNSRARNLEVKAMATLEKQELSKEIHSVEIQDNILAYVLQDNENWIEINDTVFSQEVRGHHLCIRENDVESKSFDKRNRPSITIATDSLNLIVTKHNSKLLLNKNMHCDTLKIFAFDNSKVKLEDVEAAFVSIECEENSSVKISNLTSDGLHILASNNSHVKVKGHVNYAGGKVNGNAYVKIPLVCKSDFSKEDNASFSMY